MEPTFIYTEERTYTYSVKSDDEQEEEDNVTSCENVTDVGLPTLDTEEKVERKHEGTVESKQTLVTVKSEPSNMEECSGSNQKESLPFCLAARVGLEVISTLNWPGGPSATSEKWRKFYNDKLSRLLYRKK
jgi:hypothetical protein